MYLPWLFLKKYVSPLEYSRVCMNRNASFVVLRNLTGVFCLLLFAQVEPIRNLFAALFLASIGMLIHVHFLWNHVDILLASVILVFIVKSILITVVVKGFGYNNKTSVLVKHYTATLYLCPSLGLCRYWGTLVSLLQVGMSLAQIGEFAFVLLSRASNLHLVEVSPATAIYSAHIFHPGMCITFFNPLPWQAKGGKHIFLRHGSRSCVLGQSHNEFVIWDPQII